MCRLDMDILKKLCMAVGISGDESPVRDIIMEEIKDSADDIKITELGDLIVFKKGAKIAPRKLMISTSMDEVGLIVTDITSDGYLKFASVGNVESNVLLGKTVYVNGNIRGLIGGKPIHLMDKEERERAVSIEELTVDIGASSKEEAMAVCSVGDNMNFVPTFECSGETVMGKSLDSRIGCAVLISLIKSDMPYDTYFAFTTRGKVGNIGAAAAAYDVDPELVIAVDGTFAGDVLRTSSPKSSSKIGNGPSVSFIDRGTMYDRKFFKAAFQCADELGFKCQPKTNAAGRNDAASIHSGRSGARAAAASVPCRYVNSVCSLAKISDAENTVKLVRALSGKMMEV